MCGKRCRKIFNETKVPMHRDEASDLKCALENKKWAWAKGLVDTFEEYARK